MVDVVEEVEVVVVFVLELDDDVEVVDLLLVVLTDVELVVFELEVVVKLVKVEVVDVGNVVVDDVDKLVVVLVPLPMLRSWKGRASVEPARPATKRANEKCMLWILIS